MMGGERIEEGREEGQARQALLEPDALANLSETKRALLFAYFRALGTNKLSAYRPYGHPDTLWPDGSLCPQKWTNKPWQLEFHQAGKRNPERLTLCGNGVGKSLAACAEDAMHLTGQYPDWFEGKRFNKPVKLWVGSIDAGLQRDSTQALLLGPDLEEGLGSGFIPPECIASRPSVRNAGISDIVDRVMIRHVSGGLSELTFKTYQQGWRTFQAAAPDVVHLDEEPDANDNKQKDIFVECQTRVFRSSGILYVSMTPLLGATPLVDHFMEATSSGIWYIGAGWDDAPHLKEEDKDRLRKSYPHHQADVRTLGVPMMGEGRVYQADERQFVVKPFEVPRHWARICGIDFGIGEGHPFAAAWLAWDRDADCLYLIDEYREANALPVVHAANIRRRPPWVPVAWPHDGANRDKSSGTQLADHYRNQGVNMLGYSARYDKDKAGPQALEPVIQEINERLMTGGMRVFETCRGWLEEYRNYHRRDGKIVRRKDDLISASHYAVMMKRYACTEPIHRMNQRLSGAAVVSTAL